MGDQSDVWLVLSVAGQWYAPSVQTGTIFPTQGLASRVILAILTPFFVTPMPRFNALTISYPPSPTGTTYTVANAFRIQTDAK